MGAIVNPSLVSIEEPSGRGRLADVDNGAPGTAFTESPRRSRTGE